MFDFRKRITMSPDHCGGRPCIRGLRIRVKDILAMLSEGVSQSEILENFPYLEADDIRAALAYAASPHRPLTSAEMARRQRLVSYLEKCSEDDLIAEILLPLFRQLGFHRITSVDHKDKSLEYGKDVWMRYVLPTQHVLYFGVQAKKGKLDSAGASKGSNANIAEIYNQVLMMLGHEIFDPETSKRVLVDHAFIVAGSEITKQAKNWLGGKLDATKRSQVMFMDRDDILNLYIVNNLTLPEGAIEPASVTFDDATPF